jgi:phosphopantothenoylcysteine decarboxylase / phosphopantothenate---cysteine ligase
MLEGKKILLGISASIAAYKSVFLVREFIKKGAEVRVIMTPASKDFVTPLTLSTLSKHPVHSEFYSKESENELWNNHVELGLWADYFVVAPATANTISKMVNGTADNLLLAAYLSAKCPVYVAPAMDLDMYKHPSTIHNLEQLKSFGNIIIPSVFGELASGLVGEGRLAEPDEIVRFIEADLRSKAPLSGKKILITAGPTFEAIDPVRFIGNHSSGKMGYALADKAAKLGAEVVLVSGPVSIQTTHPGIRRIDVQTAAQMLEACSQHMDYDIAIMSAAVADYRPEETQSEKIKKTVDSLSIHLVKNPDILATLGEKRKSGQVLVGFALETENQMENAVKKLISKKADAIILNSPKDAGAGFGVDTNKVYFVMGKNNYLESELLPKSEIALFILDNIQSKLMK